MPIYEYECAGCGGRFEVSLKFSDPAVSQCSMCGSSSIRKLFSPAAFVLKGSGWYATDYASCERKKAGESEAPKAETKPAPACSAGSCASGECPSKG